MYSEADIKHCFKGTKYAYRIESEKPYHIAGFHLGLLVQRGQHQIECFEKNLSYAGAVSRTWTRLYPCRVRVQYCLAMPSGGGFVGDTVAESSCPASSPVISAPGH